VSELAVVDTDVEPFDRVECVPEACRPEPIASVAHAEREYVRHSDIEAAAQAVRGAVERLV